MIELAPFMWEYSDSLCQARSECQVRIEKGELNCVVVRDRRNGRYDVTYRNIAEARQDEMEIVEKS